jgi:hypothetical protein
LGLPADPGKNGPPINALLDRLRADPWWRPTSDSRSGPLTREADLQIVSRIGAFRGFGGLFMSPPVVSLEDGHFVLEESGNYWLLTADVFGATLHRWSKPPRAARSVQAFQIDPNGVVTNGKLSRTFPELAGAASAAASPTTLAVTTSLSHAVFLVALAHSGRR